MNGPTVQHHLNGVSEGGPSTRVDVIDTAGGRILCIADIRGNLSLLNEYAAQHKAQAIIHTGDFGFFDRSSMMRISERTLRHLVQYSNLLAPTARQTIMAASTLDAMRTAVNNAAPNGFALSEFPKLLTGELKLNVPVYTVYGACEDVGILERLRATPSGPVSTQANAAAGPSGSSWSIPNLTVLSEGVTRVLVIGGVRLRLFGLGGAMVPHKFFDNGEGRATIAGSSGTMWTTILQLGELVDTAQRVYDQSETRLLITHASPGREGLLAQLALALKADLTISAGLHFRYGVSYNEYSVQHDADAYRQKLEASKLAFHEVWDTVKSQVDQVVDEHQRKFLDNALAVARRVPPEPSAGQSGANVEEPAWKNSWNWNLPDATYGSLVLDIRDGRFSSEMRSQGFNFAYRAQQGNGPRGPSVKVPPSQHQQHLQQGPQSQKPVPPTTTSVVDKKPLPPHASGPISDRPRSTGPLAKDGGDDRPPHHHQHPHHHDQNERGSRGRGRGHLFRGGAGQPRPFQNREAASSEGGAPSETSVKQEGGSNAEDNASSGGGASSAGRGFMRGGRGRGRGEGRGDFRGGRGAFRGRGGQHSNAGGSSSQNESPAGFGADSTPTTSTSNASAPPAAAAASSSNGPPAATASSETGWH